MPTVRSNGMDSALGFVQCRRIPPAPSGYKYIITVEPKHHCYRILAPSVSGIHFRFLEQVPSDLVLCLIKTDALIQAEEVARSVSNGRRKRKLLSSPTSAMSLSLPTGDGHWQIRPAQPLSHDESKSSHVLTRFLYVSFNVSIIAVSNKSHTTAIDCRHHLNQRRGKREWSFTHLY